MDRRTLNTGSKNHFYIHGMSESTTYRIWVGIFTRCYNPNSLIYKYYGGRGIKVCDRWHSFINFYEDMGSRPCGLQIDRINNDGDYGPDNCRWVTARENNAANKGTLKDKMPGMVFGKWLVIERSVGRPGHRYYLCICKCGEKSILCGGELRRGRTTQCRECKRKSHGSIHRGWSERKKVSASRD